MYTETKIIVPIFLVFYSEAQPGVDGLLHHALGITQSDRHVCEMVAGHGHHNTLARQTQHGVDAAHGEMRDAGKGRQSPPLANHPPWRQ